MKNSAQSDLDCRIDRARLSGAMHGYTPAEFKNYLLEIGLNKYEKAILPVEKEGKYPASEPDQVAKIIPFPGASLPDVPLADEDKFQNDMEGFLQEMGYIEQ